MGVCTNVMPDLVHKRRGDSLWPSLLYVNGESLDMCTCVCVCMHQVWNIRASKVTVLTRIGLFCLIRKHSMRLVPLSHVVHTLAMSVYLMSLVRPWLIKI